MSTPENLPQNPFVAEPVLRSGMSPFYSMDRDIARRLQVGFVVRFEEVS